MITLSKEIRDSITPEMAIDILKLGNERFINNLKTNHNLLKQMNETSVEQNPFALVLSCIDSRTSAELIFDQGLGDILSCRIAGNILNDDIIGSMEFACKIIGVKLIVVLGHSGCGAIRGACSQIKMGKLTGLLNKIKPSVEVAKSSQTNNSSSYSQSEFIEQVAEINAKQVAQQITKESTIVSDLQQQGKIAIISGMYNVGTGMVDFY